MLSPGGPPEPAIIFFISSNAEVFLNSQNSQRAGGPTTPVITSSIIPADKNGYFLFSFWQAYQHKTSKIHDRDAEPRHG
jgi:hypothetical protein